MSGSLDQYDDHIVGMILNLKPSKYRISLWIRSSTNFDQIIEMSQRDGWHGVVKYIDEEKYA